MSTNYYEQARDRGIYNQIFREYPDVIGIADLQKMLNIGRNSSYTLINTGTIQSIKVGRIHKIPKIRVIDYLLNKNKS